MNEQDMNRDMRIIAQAQNELNDKFVSICMPGYEVSFRMACPVRAANMFVITLKDLSSGNYKTRTFIGIHDAVDWAYHTLKLDNLEGRASYCEHLKNRPLAE